MGNTHFTVNQVARKLALPINQVEEQIKRGRVEVYITKGLRFLTDRDVYKIRFAVYLQKERRLTPEQIDWILQTATPPYTSWMNELGALSDSCA